MRRSALVFLAVLVLPGFISSFLSGPASAQLLDMLTAPKTLVDRAIEARKAGDIVEDNRIVIDVNKVMADLGTIKASTEIYEQQLLITGIFDDRAVYDKFRAGVNKVKGVKKLRWHATYMSKQEQERRKASLVDWKDALVIEAKVRANLIKTRGIADVNYKTAIDSFATVYILGRARSGEEMKKVLDVVSRTEGVKKVVNYGYVKP
jgi:osmotically-inducible protein OsmY